MRATLLSGIAILVVSSALAQPAAPPSPAGAAAPQATKPAGPAATVPPASGSPTVGANSFTEAQAKSHIEAQGYTGVTALTKEANGMWRGKATKDGKSVDISLDTQGKVVVR